MIRSNIVRSAIVGALLMAISVAPVEAITPKPAAAAKPVARVIGTSSHSTILIGKTFVLSGKVTPARVGVVLKRQRYVSGKWQTFGALTRTNAQGKWSMRFKAPSTPTTFKVRVVAPKFPRSTPYRKAVTVTAPIPDPSATIDLVLEDQSPGTFIMLTGTHAYPGTNMQLTVQRYVEDAWVDMPLNEFDVSRTSWRARVLLPAIAGPYSYRAIVRSSRGDAVSEPVTVSVVAPTLNSIAALGPGNPSRIWGIDVARWQHVTGDPAKNNGLPIDWKVAYDRGIRFAFIKASDGNPVTDARAKKWAIDDHRQAQEAGIYTGLYHFPSMPDVSGPANNPAILVADAREEAIQAADRLAEMGGYTSMDLPYVLDFESDAIPGSGISDISTKASVTLWLKTWLLEMKARTGRMPILYSGPSFLGAQLDRTDPFWKDITLWIARYTCATNPATGKCDQITHSAAVQRLNNGATPGVYSTPWSTPTGMNWTFWQYSSRGNGAEFGIKNGAALDMNVFNGSTEQFLALVNQTWAPSVGDYDATAAVVDVNMSYDTADSGAPVTLNVSASRRDNSAPCVSGELTVLHNGAAIPGSSVSYNGVGKFKITLPAREIGTVWNLQLNFTDEWGFYAPASANFTIAIPSTL